MEGFRKFWTDILTGTSGTHFEAVRAGMIWCLISLSALQAYALFKLETFSPENFGIAAGAILTAGGAGALMKDSAKTKADATPGAGEAGN